MKPLFEQIAAMQDIIRADEPAPKKKDCRWCGGTQERGEGGGGCSWCDGEEGEPLDWED